MIMLRLLMLTVEPMHAVLVPTTSTCVTHEDTLGQKVIIQVAKDVLEYPVEPKPEPISNHQLPPVDKRTHRASRRHH